MSFKYKLKDVNEMKILNNRQRIHKEAVRLM